MKALIDMLLLPGVVIISYFLIRMNLKYFSRFEKLEEDNK